MSLPPRATFEQLRALAPSLAGARHLHVPDAAAAFGGFESPALRLEFEAWLDRVATHWCCRRPQEAERLGKPVKSRLNISAPTALSAASSARVYV